MYIYTYIYTQFLYVNICYLKSVSTAPETQACVGEVLCGSRFKHCLAEPVWVNYGSVTREAIKGHYCYFVQPGETENTKPVPMWLYRPISGSMHSNPKKAKGKLGHAVYTGLWVPPSPAAPAAGASPPAAIKHILNSLIWAVLA